MLSSIRPFTHIQPAFGKKEKQPVLKPALSQSPLAVKRRKLKAERKNTTDFLHETAVRVIKALKADNKDEARQGLLELVQHFGVKAGLNKNEFELPQIRVCRTLKRSRKRPKSGITIATYKTESGVQKYNASILKTFEPHEIASVVAHETTHQLQHLYRKMLRILRAPQGVELKKKGGFFHRQASCLGRRFKISSLETARPEYFYLTRQEEIQARIASLKAESEYLAGCIDSSDERERLRTAIRSERLLFRLNILMEQGKKTGDPAVRQIVKALHHRTMFYRELSDVKIIPKTLDLKVDYYTVHCNPRYQEIRQEVKRRWGIKLRNSV